jgi:hypothetical protein
MPVPVRYRSATSCVWLALQRASGILQERLSMLMETLWLAHSNVAIGQLFIEPSLYKIYVFLLAYFLSWCDFIPHAFNIPHCLPIWYINVYIFLFSSIADEDPCRSGRSKCGEHSSCLVEGDTFKCVCNPGWVARTLMAMCKEVNLEHSASIMLDIAYCLR